MNIFQQLVANIVETEFGSLDEATITRAKWRIIDTIGCLIGGANGSGCRMMLDLIKKWGGAGESTILIHGSTVPMQNAAMINSLMARSMDFEPVGNEGINGLKPAHISATTVPTAFAVAEHQAANGKDLITALVLGDDLTSRLGDASDIEDYIWDNCGTTNMFGATAIAGKLLRLDTKQMQNAFGIVINQLAGSIDGCHDKVMAFKLPNALAARNGIFSAELAKQGFTGNKDPFLGAHGYFAQYCHNYNINNLNKNLGKRFYADGVIKPYPACREIHSAIDSALKVACRDDVQAENINEIILHVTLDTINGPNDRPFVLGETPQIDAVYNIRYNVASALLRKAMKPEHFLEESIHDPGINVLIKKMSLVPSIPSEKPFTTEIQVIMKNGKVFSAHTDVPKGDIFRNPISEEEIKAKYKANIYFSKTIPIQKAEKALVLMESLEKLDNISELVDLLVM